jgi:hypothetical protein
MAFDYDKLMDVVKVLEEARAASKAAYRQARQWDDKKGVWYAEGRVEAYDHALTKVREAIGG